jgi:uncharacterized protein involved in outer membrane biogenesis
MLKKILIGIAVLMLVAAAALSFWARSILATDTVRMALASQVSKAIGQPVTINNIGATIYPRVTVNLGGVEIGNPARIKVKSLKLGTDFRALLSRQIAHATLRLDGARIELPLPPFGVSEAPSSSSEPHSVPVEIVSIDEIVLRGVEIVSGGHMLRGEIDAVPQGKGLALRKGLLRAEDATINVTGEIADAAGPVGTLSIKADALNLDRLLAFASDFSSGLGPIGHPSTKPGSAQAPKAAAAGMNIAVSLNAGRATIGQMTLDHLAGSARITPKALTLDPIAFGLFKGHYNGSLVLTLGNTPDFRLKASLADVDMATAAAFAGSPNTITGRLSGHIDLAGRGLNGEAVNRSSHGTVRVDIRDGVVKNLGLVRAVVIATSGRADSDKSQISGGSADEPFSRLGATLAVANGQATTNDLQFESTNLSAAAEGSIALNGSAVNLKGQVQLSDALSQQAGRDLIRYTQEHGRVTLPVTVTGSAANLSTRVDVGSLAERAILNRANEELGKILKKGVGGWFK